MACVSFMAVGVRLLRDDTIDDRWSLASTHLDDCHEAPLHPGRPGSADDAAVDRCWSRYAVLTFTGRDAPDAQSVGRLMPPSTWPGIQDEGYVERLIPAIQQAIADVSADRVDASGTIGVSGPDLANALLILLASVVESGTTTPMAVRKMSEAMAKELQQLVRETRQLRAVEAVNQGTTN